MIRSRDERVAQALDREGFFKPEEGELLMSYVGRTAAHEAVLEVGSYHGRSTLFGLAALGQQQRWYAVDSFRIAAAYSGHSYAALLDNVDDPRLRLLPMTLAQAWPHLRTMEFGLVFLDGDHSMLGFAQDVTIALNLLRGSGVLLCHDVTELFPAVPLLTDSLVAAGVLAERERVDALVAFDVLGAPSWLVDPDVYRD